MNSRVALAEAAKLIGKLIDRTREGKIAWRTNQKHNSLSVLETSLEASLKVTVWMANSEAGFRVSQIRDVSVEVSSYDDEVEAIEDSGATLLSISLKDEHRRDYDFPEEQGIYRELVDLHELARRSAYKMDTQFENINNYLDRLAG